MIPRLVTAFVGWAASIFMRIERSGPPVPEGPVLVTANHPNSLLDPLVLFHTVGRPTRPLAKAPLFEQLVVGTILRGLGGLPVYRKQDDPALMHLNDETFAGAVRALHAGDAVQIYPEGRSHSEPELAPLRTGAARIALRAEAERDWQLRLHIVPVGLTYHRKSAFRGIVLATVGEPFRVDSWRAHYQQDPVDAVRALTEEIGQRLRALTINLTATEHQVLIETAERLYVRERGEARFREREPLAERVPRMRLFAEGLAWLRAHDPAELDRLVHAVGRYQRLSAMAGVTEGDVPPRYEAGSTVRYVLRQSLALLLGLPLAVLGTMLWYPTYLTPRFVLPRIHTEADTVATYKFASGFVAALVTLVLVGIAGGWWWGAPGVLLSLAGALLLGLFAIAWHERRQRALEDATLFFQVLSRPRIAPALAARRAQLAHDFDRVLERMRTAPGGQPAGD